MMETGSLPLNLRVINFSISLCCLRLLRYWDMELKWSVSCRRYVCNSHDLVKRCTIKLRVGTVYSIFSNALVSHDVVYVPVMEFSSSYYDEVS